MKKEKILVIVAAILLVSVGISPVVSAVIKKAGEIETEAAIEAVYDGDCPCTADGEETICPLIMEGINYIKSINWGVQQEYLVASTQVIVIEPDQGGGIGEGDGEGTSGDGEGTAGSSGHEGLGEGTFESKAETMDVTTEEHEKQNYFGGPYNDTYRERIEELEEYCELGTQPGGWFVPERDAAAFCIAGGIATLGVASFIASAITVNLLIGMSIILAVAAFIDVLVSNYGTTIIDAIIAVIEWCMALFGW